MDSTGCGHVQDRKDEAWVAEKIHFRRKDRRREHSLVQAELQLLSSEVQVVATEPS